FPRSSPQALALKSYGASIYLKAANLKQAEEALRNSSRQEKDETKIDQKFVDLSCQVRALHTCHFETEDPCLKEKTWQDWNTGCELTKTSLSSPTEKLAHWWKLAQGLEIKNQSYLDWQKDFQNINSQKESFEKTIGTALD